MKIESKFSSMVNGICSTIFSAYSIVHRISYGMKFNPIFGEIP